MSGSDTPRRNSGKGIFATPLDRFLKEEMTSGFTLLDTMETYFDSHVDLLQRRLQKHSDRLKMKAEETFKMRDLSGDLLAENFEKEVKNFKLKVAQRMNKLQITWQSDKVVRTREKVSFFVGVMTLLCSALMLNLAPQWIHVVYTVIGGSLLTTRAYLYKKRGFHYFLFDLCYFVTIINFVYLWFFPSNAALFVACYCLSNGSLASAVITWRNSLVFHDLDKVTSLFIHIYPPFTFTVIRHFYPDAHQRFPALNELAHINPLRAMLLTGGIYVVWQLLYYKFVLVDRWAKIESGQRTTSFSFLLNEKRGLIGKALSAVPANSRIFSFMTGQLLYTVLTQVPAVYVLYDSAFWSGVFLMVIFSVSVWNGGGYYIEVFGRKFERELEALRKELAESSRSSTGSTSGRSSPSLSRVPSDDGLSSLESSPTMTPQNLPAAVLNGSDSALGKKED
ncbi:hypothetical protein PM082_004979 [Marasmius tenuissimus]|nr:hypothetical protein PM082_004979 [Marasmius tenuissimus]